VDAPEVARQLIATPKLIIIIVWSISGIHVIIFLQVLHSIPRTSSITSYVASTLFQLSV
jgi:ABC-type sugar transport system permease subunit